MPRDAQGQICRPAGGYHGDTFGAMSVCDPDGGMHELYKGCRSTIVDAQLPLPRRVGRAGVVELATLVADHHEEIAAIVLEPIVQGAGALLSSPLPAVGARPVRRVRPAADCRRNRHRLWPHRPAVCLRLGRHQPRHHVSWQGAHRRLPDTVGHAHYRASLARTVCDGKAGVFMHGPTFMGNPLACAVANASIELLLASPWQARVQAIEHQLKTELMELTLHPAVADVRVLSAIGVVR
jgi:adenosylmethionine-8-amino-7-oxononanoate aminotransferase